MTEIFENIPDKVKESAKNAFEVALLLPTPMATVKFLDEYTNSCQNEEEQDFVRFYFGMRMEQMLNENSNDQR